MFSEQARILNGHSVGCVGSSTLVVEVLWLRLFERKQHSIFEAIHNHRFSNQ